jgi:hypothetical protein
VEKAGGKIDDVCGGKKKGYCPLHINVAGADGCCGRQRQLAHAYGGGPCVWLLPHAMMFRKPPRPLRPMTLAPRYFAATIIDESPFLSAIHGCGETPYRLLVPTFTEEWAGPYAVAGRPGDPPGYDPSARLAEICARVFAVLDPHPEGWIAPGRFHPTASSGVTKESCVEARDLVFRCLQPVPPHVVPGFEWVEARDAMAPLQAHNIRLRKMARFFGLLAQAIEDGHAATPFLMKEIEKKTTPEGELVCEYVRMRWKDDLADEWTCRPLLYLDGTMQPDWARLWLQRLTVDADVRVAPNPNVFRRQVTDSAVGYEKVVPDRKASAKNQQTAGNNLQRLSALFEVRAHDFAGQGRGEYDGLVVAPLGSEPHLLKILAKRFGALHFNANRGVNAFDGVRYHAIISRPLPPPCIVEQMAWVAAGLIGEPINDWYPTRAVGRLMTDGTGRVASAVYHPDPTAELVRWAICEGELLQAEARSRSVRRDVTSPLLIEMITNVPLPLPVDDLVTWKGLIAEGGPIYMAMHRLGGVVPLIGEWLVARFPALFSSLRTTKKEVVEAAETKTVQHSYRDIYPYRKLAQFRADGARGPLSKALVAPEAKRPAEMTARMLGRTLKEFQIGEDYFAWDVSPYPLRLGRWTAEETRRYIEALRDGTMPAFLDWLRSPRPANVVLDTAGFRWFGAPGQVPADRPARAVEPDPGLDPAAWPWPKVAGGEVAPVVEFTIGGQ